MCELINIDGAEIQFDQVYCMQKALSLRPHYVGEIGLLYDASLEGLSKRKGCVTNVIDDARLLMDFEVVKLSCIHFNWKVSRLQNSLKTTEEDMSDIWNTC